jgi:hypothetical protein
MATGRDVVCIQRGDVLIRLPHLIFKNNIRLCERSCGERRNHWQMRSNPRREAAIFAASSSYTPTIGLDQLHCLMPSEGRTDGLARKISEAATHVAAARHSGREEESSIPLLFKRLLVHQRRSGPPNDYLFVPLPFSRHCFNPKQTHGPSLNWYPEKSSTARQLASPLLRNVFAAGVELWTMCGNCSEARVIFQRSWQMN